MTPDGVTGDPQPFDVPLVSTRVSTESKGSVKVKLGFVRPQNAQLLMDFPDIYAEIVNRSRPSIVSAPPVSPDRDPLSSRASLMRPISAYRPRASVQSVLSRVPLTSRTMVPPPMTTKKTTTISWQPLMALRPRFRQQISEARPKHRPPPQSPAVGLPSSSLANGSGPPVRTRGTPRSPPIPPRLLRPRQSPLLRRTSKRRDADLEGPGRLAAVNTASTRRTTLWVSSCWRSRALAISLNLATVRMFVTTTFPIDP